MTKSRSLPWAAVMLVLAAAAPAAESPSLLDRSAPIVSEVQRRFGDDVRILSLEVWPEEAFVAVQDPQNAAHVDRYGFRDGALTSPEPQAVGRNRRELKARLFPVRDVDLSVLPAMVGAAPGVVETEDGRVTHAVVERSQGWNDSSWGRPRWRVHVEGPRGGGYVEYGLDGKRGRVVKW